VVKSVDVPESSPDLATEERILEAAHRVFLRRGTAGARTQEIADEAGVNKALLHYYYRTKGRLAEAVFLRAAGTLFPRMLAALAADRPLRDKLRDAVEAESDMLEANPYLPGYLIAEFQYEPERLRDLIAQALPVSEMRAAVLGGLQRQLDAEAEAGRLRPTRAEDLVVALMAQTVFPYAAAPMIEAVLGLDDDARREMAARRRADLADTLLRSLAP
jgi:AcrR family transcriptional regulator